MRTLSLFLAVAVVGLVGCDAAAPADLAPTATASAASGASAGGSGHLTVNDEYRTFSFTAREKRNGVGGRFNLQARQSGNHLRGEATCLGVIGDQAYVGGTILTNEGFPEGSSFVFSVIDNGEGRNAPADEISFVFSVTEATRDAFCDGAFTIATRPIEGGNIQVRP